MESYLDISSQMSVIGKYAGGTEKTNTKKHFTTEKHDAEAGGKNSAARLPGAEPFLLSGPFSHDLPLPTASQSSRPVGSKPTCFQEAARYPFSAP